MVAVEPLVVGHVGIDIVDVELLQVLGVSERHGGEQEVRSAVDRHLEADFDLVDDGCQCRRAYRRI